MSKIAHHSEDVGDKKEKAHQCIFRKKEISYFFARENNV